MFRELAESLRQQLEEALSLPVAFADPEDSLREATASSASHSKSSDASDGNSNQSSGLTLVWLGLKEFVSRRTPSAYDQTAMHLSGKLEYLAYPRHLSALEMHDCLEKLLRSCTTSSLDYALVELTDPCWAALGVRPRPALRVLRGMTLELPIGEASALVETVVLNGRLTASAHDRAAPSPRDSRREPARESKPS